MSQPALPAVTLDENGAALINATVTGGGGGGLGDYENVVVVAKSGADYSTVATGEAALAAQDLLAVMPGIYNENVTFDIQYTTILGFGGGKDSGRFVLGGSDDVGPIADVNDDIKFIGVRFSRTLSGGAGAYIGVDASVASKTIQFERCAFLFDGAATGRDVTGVKLNGGGSDPSKLSNCLIDMANEGSGEAVDLAGGDIVIEGCDIDGDVVCSAATDTRIRSTRIEGDLTGVAGSDLYLQDVEVTGSISGWDNVYVEGAYDDPGANARTLATDVNGLLTLHDLKVTDSAANKPEVVVENTNDDANPPALLFIKDSASPADDDWLGAVDWYGDDSGGNQTRFGYIAGRSADVTDGDEAGELIFRVLMDGTARDLLRLSGYNGSVNEGEIIFNDDQQDVDVRVEASGESHALFIRGSDGNVGIKESSPGYDLEIAGQTFGTSDTYPVIGFRRTTTVTGGAFGTLNGIASAMGLYTETDGNMTDGFGGGIVFLAKDDTSPDSTLSRIYARRDGGDTAGALEFMVNGDDTALILRASGRVGIGTVSPGGQTSIDQSSSTGAIPVLELDQADLSEEFINFISSVGDGYPVDNVNAVGSAYARLRVAVNGTFKYLQLYNA